MPIATAIFLQQPEIYLELEPDKLLKAMSLVKSMKGLKIKLSKINGQVKLIHLCLIIRFCHFALSRALVCVILAPLFHIITRNIGKRMRNDISGLIQDSKQHSSLPYHLICVVADSFLLQSILPSHLPIKHKIILFLPYHLILHMIFHCYQKYTLNKLLPTGT